MKKTIIIICACCIFSIQARAGDEPACKAARANAAVKLTEQIAEMGFGEGRTVGDFLSRSPSLRPVLISALMQSAKVTKLSTSTEAGVATRPATGVSDRCRVEMQISLEKIRMLLSLMCSLCGEDDDFTPADFADLEEHNRRDSFASLGTAAAPHWPGGNVFVEVPPAGLDDEKIIPPDEKKYWWKHCRPGGREAAVEAALSQAQRRLGRRVMNAYITPDMTVGQFVDSSSTGQIDPRGFIIAARPVGVYYHHDAPVVEVKVSVELRSVYAAVRTWARANSPQKQEVIARLEDLIINSSDETISQIGVGIPGSEQLVDVNDRAQAKIALAEDVPAWLGSSLKASGAKPQDLRVGRIDGADEQLPAIMKLIERVCQLSVTEGVNVAELAAKDDRILEALAVVARDAGPTPIVRTVSADTQPATATAPVRMEMEIDLLGLWRMLMHFAPQFMNR